VAETLLQFQSAIEGPDGIRYRAKACGSPMPDGMWQGWLEFEPLDGGAAARSHRETTQPNRTDIDYWASGLTPIYLEGALRRALDGPVRVPVVAVEPPLFDEPAPSVVGTTRDATPHGVLDPFSVIEKGEPLLRRQLGALSAWHLVNIILNYELSEEPVERLNVLPAASLIEIIVSGVRDQTARTGRKR
jgi:hypothetical protein